MISVIVPVYNGEKYIKRCLQSIIEQDYNNIEILVIINGTTDKTEEKAKEIKDNRIKIFTLEEKGVSNARNFGIDKALGEYVIFIDSDDWIEKDMLSFMINKIKSTKSDMVRVNYFINKVIKKNYCKGELDEKYRNS